MHLGVPWAQNAKGHLLGDVKDQGKALDDPTARGNEIGGSALGFHSDGSDLVGLLCLDPGVSGGESLISNALLCHNLLAASDPNSQAPSTRGFPTTSGGSRLRTASPTTTCLRSVGGRASVRSLHPAIHPGVAAPRVCAPAHRDPEGSDEGLLGAGRRSRPLGRDELRRATCSS